MFKNLSSNAGKASLIPGWGTEMPHVAGLSPRTATTKPMLQSPHCTTKQKPVHHTKRPCMSQLIPDTARQIDTYEKYIIIQVYTRITVYINIVAQLAQC